MPSPSMPTSSSLSITGLAVGQEYFVRVAVHTQSGSGDFSCWQSVTTYEGVRMTSLCYSNWLSWRNWSSCVQCLNICGMTVCKYWTGLYRLWVFNLTKLRNWCAKLCCVGELLLPTNTLGPVPRDVTVFPNGCQSLRVIWTPQAPTPPLTLIHYRVRYQAQEGSYQDAFTPSGSSYTITGLIHATRYTVTVEAQTELGYGGFCCEPMASTNNGKAPSDAWGHMPTPCSYGTVTATQHTICIAILHLLLSMDPIDACSDKILVHAVKP